MAGTTGGPGLKLFVGGEDVWVTLGDDFGG